MQFFIGLKEFDPQPVFNSSLFVEIRKRVGHEAFDSVTVVLINSFSQEEDNKHNKKDNDQSDHPNKGKMQAAATATNSVAIRLFRKSQKMEDRSYFACVRL